MIKVAVFGKKIDNVFREQVIFFLEKLKNKGIKIYLHENLLNYLHENNVDYCKELFRFKFEQDITTEFALFFSIGGDGTMLEAVKYVKDKNIPIVGINIGRLGFLANISPDELDSSLSDLIKGNYISDYRTLLMLCCDNNPFVDFSYALNEITIQKHDTSLIAIEALMDGEEINRYWADGLIISTPTGSTAYSLSTGGPIISPDTKAFIITPIASHNLTVRPLVIPDSKIIKVKASSRSGKFLVTLDSHSVIFQNDDVFEIQLAPFKIRLAQLPKHSFFQTIRKKLMWGADIRN